jgi:hypothetical protein
MKHDIDVTADLTAQDGDGLGWSTLAAARDPSHVRPGGALPRRQLLRAGPDGGVHRFELGPSKRRVFYRIFYRAGRDDPVRVGTK